MDSQTPHDILNVILSFLDNLDLASLAMTGRFWAEYTRRVIPIDPSLAPYLVVHFAHYRRFYGPCQCFLCKEEDNLQNIVRITKHVRGPFDPDWKSYVHPDDHYLVSDDALLLTVAIPPKISMSRAFAETITSDLVTDCKKASSLYSARLTGPNDEGTTFLEMFPANSGITILSQKNIWSRYCADRNSPYYNHLITHNIHKAMIFDKDKYKVLDF